MSVAGVWRQEGEVSMACRIWLVGSDPVVGGELEGWLHYYNQHRPHTACGNQPPFSRLINVSDQYS